MPNVLYSDIFLNPSFDHVRVRFLLQLQLLEWFELAFSLRDPFVLWWHPAEHSNFAFSTAWDFTKIFEVCLEKVTTYRDHSWQLAVNLGFFLPVHSWFCPDPQFMLDAQRSGLFPYLFLLVFIGFFNYYFGCRSVNYLFPIIDSLTISGKYSKKENRGFAAVQGLISYYLTVIYQIMNF